VVQNLRDIIDKQAEQIKAKDQIIRNYAFHKREPQCDWYIQSECTCGFERAMKGGD
jgi:hypothetical protein